MAKEDADRLLEAAKALRDRSDDPQDQPLFMQTASLLALIAEKHGECGDDPNTGCRSGSRDHNVRPGFSVWVGMPCQEMRFALDVAATIEQEV